MFTDCKNASQNIKNDFGNPQNLAISYRTIFVVFLRSYVMLKMTTNDVILCRIHHMDAKTVRRYPSRLYYYPRTCDHDRKCTTQEGQHYRKCYKDRRRSTHPRARLKSFVSLPHARAMMLLFGPVRARNTGSGHYKKRAQWDMCVCVCLCVFDIKLEMYTYAYQCLYRNSENLANFRTRLRTLDVDERAVTKPARISMFAHIEI
jgi:hypothetical protein